MRKALSRTSLSRALSQRATTMVAHALPIKLVNARHSDIKRSIPKISAIPATGTAGTTYKVAASVIKPAPVTPAAPLELTIATKSNATCSPIDKSTLHACAINKAAIVI